MKFNIFREYDIRAIIGKELEINEAYILAKAIVSYFLQKNPQITSIVVGRDGRNHSLPIRNEMVKAITDLGLNVIDIGLCPTPVFYYTIYTTQFQSGFIITASHNPKEYNGFKMMLEKKAVWGQQVQEIKEILQTQTFYQNKDGKKGTIKNLDIIPEYLNYLYSNFTHLHNLDIHAVIDCGNGSAGSVLPELVKKMNWPNVKLLFADIDGNFPNHEADPTILENMKHVAQELKKDPKLELGLGLDGDCDRMNPMTKLGKLVPGDQLLAIYAQKVLKRFPKAAIVFDIKASGSLIEILRAWGAKDCFSPSGHALVKQAMLKNDAKLAGELSCHFFFNDVYFGYDDGIYAILRLFEILNETKQNLEDLLKIFPEKKSSPEFRIPCTDSNKKEIVEHVKKIFAAKKDAEILTIDGIRVQMKYGWGLVRASNTQPVICVRFESDTEQGFGQVKQDFYKALLPYFQEDFLKNQLNL